MKEMIQCPTLGIPKGMKNAIPISLFALSVKLPRNTKQKPFEIILHVGRVTNL